MKRNGRARNGVEAKRRRRRIAERLLRARPKMMLRSFLRALDESYRIVYAQEFKRWYPPRQVEVFNWAPIYPVVDEFWRATA